MSSPITMTDAVRQAILYQLTTIHTALPATIISYDYTKQRAKVKPVLNKFWSDGTFTEMPIINDVPVIFPRSGGASLTFPVAEGDFCLIVFSERSLDNWLAEGGNSITPNDQRKFNLSDAMAIMGIFPFTENSQAENNDDVLLTYKGSKIKIKSSGDIVIDTASKVAIGNNTTEVLDILSQLMGYLITATVGSVPFDPPFPLNVTNLQTQINSIKGTI